MESVASSIVPAGLVSVMPQPWTSGTPRPVQVSRIDKAQGAPPTPATRSRERSASPNLGCCIMNWYGAGTAKKWVIPNDGSEM